MNAPPAVLQASKVSGAILGRRPGRRSGPSLCSPADGRTGVKWGYRWRFMKALEQLMGEAAKERLEFHALRITTAAVLCWIGLCTTRAEAASLAASSSMITMDYARYLAPIDLHFTKPTKPIEGVPLGNGKMGTLVWVDGSGSKLEFNFGRPDVFYMGSATSTWSNKSHTDG